MMDLLPLYIPAHSIDDRLTNPDSKVLMLPAEPGRTKLLLIDPMRGFAFKKLGNAGDSLLRSQRDKAVTVFSISANVVEVDIFLTRVLPYMVENDVPNIVG